MSTKIFVRVRVGLGLGLGLHVLGVELRIGVRIWGHLVPKSDICLEIFEKIRTCSEIFRTIRTLG